MAMLTTVPSMVRELTTENLLECREANRAILDMERSGLEPWQRDHLRAELGWIAAELRKRGLNWLS